MYEAFVRDLLLHLYYRYCVFTCFVELCTQAVSYLRLVTCATSRLFMVRVY